MVLSTEVLLSVSGISKSFGGAKALDDVSVDFRAGEVHALLGENGAGKSTLVKVIAGVVTADVGEVSFAGGSADVAMVFQELSVIPELSVRDNKALSMPPTSGLLVRREKLQERMQSALAAAGLEDLDLDMPVEAMPLAKRQLLEIARGLVADARTLILDEPTATLSDVEISRVHEVVKSPVAGGRSIVYITHRMGEVFRLADRITIMRSGSVVASGPTADFTMDSVVTHMLGEEHTAGEATHVAESFAPEKRRKLNVRGLASGHRFSDVSFTAQAGEVTALFGQIGSGADDVVRALVGLVPVSAGDIQLNEESLSSLTRPKSQRLGIAYVSADRVLEGVFLSGGVAQNIGSGALAGVSRLGIIRADLETNLARSIATKVAFDPARIRVPVGSLSGGNQQKIAIGRALATQPDVLVLNEPTRGVDIGARAEIYRALRRPSANNVIVIVYSSDIVELREPADRVITMFRGQPDSSKQTADVTDSQILTEILHGAKA